ncbi:MAG: hypothetical protein Q8Q89_03995 [bacterium]|nr:hypothetical protein [bacterium]
MTQDKVLSKKNFSTAKSILAVLWHLKETGRDNLFAHKYIKLLCRDKNKATHRSCISRLCATGLIRKDYNKIIALTDKGKGYALPAFIEVESHLYNLQNKINKKWDRSWRIILFDIPENRRGYRDYLRKILKEVGFREFQKSIWIFPFPVPPFLKQLLLEENLKPHVRLITTKFIDNDSDLKKNFNLF